MKRDFIMMASIVAIPVGLAAFDLRCLLAYLLALYAIYLYGATKNDN